MTPEKWINVTSVYGLISVITVNWHLGPQRKLRPCRFKVWEYYRYHIHTALRTHAVNRSQFNTRFNQQRFARISKAVLSTAWPVFTFWDSVHVIIWYDGRIYLCFFFRTILDHCNWRLLNNFSSTSRPLSDLGERTNVSLEFRIWHHSELRQSTLTNSDVTLLLSHHAWQLPAGNIRSAILCRLGAFVRWQYRNREQWQ